MLKLFLKLTFLIAILTGITLGIDVIYRKQYRLTYESLPPFKVADKIADPYQIVALGNSHAQSGIDFRGYKVRGLNLAKAAQRFSFDLAALKQNANQIAPGAIILIDASQISFSHRPADQADGLQGNYYSTIAPWLIPDLNLSNYAQWKIVPFIRSPYEWRKKIGDAVRDRVSEQERWVEPPASESARPAGPQPTPDPHPEERFLKVAAIAKELAKPTPVSSGKYVDNLNFLFNKWYHTDEFNPRYFPNNRRDLEALIKYCLKQGWRPVVITIPIDAILKEGLLDDYLQVYLYDNINKTDLQGAPYLDYTDSAIIADDYLFSNDDHLNERGAIVFSYEILQTLIDHDYLPKSADGYDYTPLPKP